MGYIFFSFILLYSLLFYFLHEQPENKSELANLSSHLNSVDEAENLDIQAESGQLTAEQRNFAQGSLEPVGDTVEQLKAEEQANCQDRNEVPDGDTIQEEDSKQAAEEGLTQENVLKQKKKRPEKTSPDSLRGRTVRQSTKFRGKSAATVAPMPECVHDNANAEQAWVINNDVTNRNHENSSDTTNQDDLKPQAAGVKFPAEENAQINNPGKNCNTGFGAEDAVEQFTVEEKNKNQAKWETYSDYSSDDEDFTPAAEEKFTQEDKLQYMNIDEEKLQRALESLGLGGSFIMPDADGLISKGKKPVAHYGCANMNGPIYYKGNSSLSKTITLESVEDKTEAGRACERENSSTSTNVTNNNDTTRRQVKCPDETEENPYKDAIFRIGARDANHNDIVLLDAGKLPRKENFNNKKDFDKEARNLISYIDIYINACVDSHRFVLIVHPGNDTKCRTKSSQMGKKIYKLLKESFSDRLANCIIYKPQFKLRVGLNLRRPFMKREMRQKIVMTKSPLNLEAKYGIPEAVIERL